LLKNLHTVFHNGSTISHSHPPYSFFISLSRSGLFSFAFLIVAVLMVSPGFLTWIEAVLSPGQQLVQCYISSFVMGDSLCW
jgi:hypothetical protein